MTLNEISWNDAPEWANWLAQDMDGSWWWFEQKPSLGTHCFHNTKGKFSKVNLSDNWKKSLTERK